MEEKKKNSNKMSVGEIVIIALFLLATVGQALLWFSISVVRAEEYRRVYDNVLSLTAIVTKHDSYWESGDEHQSGETRYRSYVSYVANGVRYTEEYENESKEKYLTPVGEQVTIQVSPENPQRRVSELWGFSIAMPLILIPMSAFIAPVWRYMLRRRRNSCGTPDQETVERDLRLTVWGRYSLCFWLLLAAGWGIIYWRYQAVLGIWVLILAVIASAMWIWCLARVIRDLHNVTNQAYTQKRKTKQVTEQSAKDSNAATTLQKTQSTLEIYLPKRESPVLCYDINGKAS